MGHGLSAAAKGGTSSDITLPSGRTLMNNTNTEDHLPGLSDFDSAHLIVQRFKNMGIDITLREAADTSRAIGEYTSTSTTSSVIRWASRQETFEKARSKRPGLTEEQYKEYIKQYKMIERYLRVAPKYPYDIYRGWGEKVRDFQKLESCFRNNRPITFNGLTSSSSNFNTAKNFADWTSNGYESLGSAIFSGLSSAKVRVVYKISGGSKYGVSIKAHSRMSSENEVLFSSKAKFMVKSITQKQGYVEVDLKEL